MKKIFFLFFFLTLAIKAQNTQLSPQAEISVITCGPGHTELYATFGHSAFRIKDLPNRIDRVYNYGTFNFETPDFYLKFIQGKLLYDLRAYDFSHFLNSYHRENRWVKGQVLDLNQNETQQVFDFLENNAKPENRSYKYDFFYDNCSTKLYDVLENVLGKKLIFDPNFDTNEYTHRNLIQFYLGNHPWGDFGIDLALGSVIDRKASSKEYMFLPDYVFDAFTKVTIKNEGEIKPITKETEEILRANSFENKNTFLTPLVFFSLLALIIIVMSYMDYKRKTRNKILDFIIFFSTGFAGLLVLLLWFATDHSATANNYNIFWAFAPNLILAFLLLRSENKKWFTNYTVLLLISLDITVLLWIFKVQIFSIALVPILISLYTRYIYLWLYFKKSGIDSVR